MASDCCRWHNQQTQDMTALGQRQHQQQQQQQQRQQQQPQQQSDKTCHGRLGTSSSGWTSDSKMGVNKRCLRKAVAAVAF
jgi:hypothetical protein